MEFKLDDSQIKRLEAWQKKIKKKHGEYGLYEYRFTPTGIGNIVIIVSLLTKQELDLSDVEKW